MESLYWYIFKMLIISGILCGYYFLALKDKAIHKWNRFYLLSTVFLSLLLPLITIPIYQSIDQTGTMIRVLQSFTMQEEIVITAGGGYSWWNAEGLMLMVYSIITFIFIVTLVSSIIKIYRIRKEGPCKEVRGIHFISTSIKGTPFSFFNAVFWNPAIDLNTATGQQIFNHEMAHIKERHSWDKMCLHLVLSLFWINPFFWLIRKELSMIHEFIADKMSLEDGDTQAFAQMVLSSVYNGRSFTITNDFFHSPIKRRLIMLTKNNSKVNYFSRLLVLPLAALIFIGISCEVQTDEIPENRQNISSQLQAGNSPEDSFDIKTLYGKKVVSLDVITPNGKAMIKIVYDDGSSETITMEEARSRGSEIPPPPPPVLRLQSSNEDNAIIFSKVEKEASFPGGSKAWARYLRTVIERELGQFSDNDYGTCVLKFVVNKDGTVRDVVATTMQGTTLAGVSVEAIRKGPKWVPAMQNGHYVNAYRLQPVTLTNPK